ncbi:MAG: nucleotidyltransferase family protein [Candidatus Thermoplasmatota archaeon]
MKTIQVSDPVHAQLIERKLALGAATLDAVIASALGRTGRRARLQQFRPAVSAVCRARKVARLRIFGSAAVGKDGPDSDIDLIVDFEPGARPGLSGLYGLGEDLQDILGTKVDVTTENGLHHKIRARVVKEAEVVWTS